MVAITFGTEELIIGILAGLTYALLGVGLVLVYRASRVLHFGYGEIGAFGALVLAKLVVDVHISWWLALVAALVLGAAIGGGWERLVIRPLTNAPRAMVLVATIAIGQVMFAAQLLLPDFENTGPYPTGLDVGWNVGSFLFRGDHLLVVLFVPLIAVSLAWFLNRTVWGLAVRGAAENADAASLAGVNVARLSTVVWALSGALATLTFVLILPLRGAVLGPDTAAIGPTLLLRAFTVGLIGRMVSLPITVLGGVIFGVLEVAALANVDSPGTVDLIVFVIVLVLLLVRRPHATSDDGAGLGDRVRELPERLAAIPAARRLRLVVPVLVSLVAVGAPYVFTEPQDQYALSRFLVFALIGMSVVVIAGWGGHLSLCQFAFVGLGAMMTSGLTSRGMPFGWAIVYASAVSAVAATVVGFPALRLRGPFLAVATLGFAVAAQGWVLDQEVFFRQERRGGVARPVLGNVDLADQRAYYFLCLGAVVFVGVLLARLRRTGTGRSLVAVRENEGAASAFTVPPAATKLMAFALSGAVAGIAGGLYGGLQVSFRPFDFGPEQSIQVLTMTVVGGLGSVLGAVLGALFLVGLPTLFGTGPTVSLLTGGVGTLGVVLFARGGLLDLVLRGRERVLTRLAERREARAPQDLAGGETAKPQHLDRLCLPPRVVRGSDTGTMEAPPLRCQGVEVRFGGLVANRDVSLTVQHGEIVGLIGTNGAGKSTLMNAIGGYVPVQAGTIEAHGHDITAWPAHRRAELSIGRVFQDARLFSELTVEECVLVSLEARHRSEVIPDLFALPPARRADRRRRLAAADLIDLTGLGDYADRLIAELSTGTRRICEVACLLGTGSQLVLLDEPTGGIAQREVEAFGQVLVDVRAQLGASMLLIEHDMPLIMSISDRVVCMTAGQVIAEGEPAVIRENPAVIASYLGTDDVAIDRSDVDVARSGSQP